MRIEEIMTLDPEVVEVTDTVQQAIDKLFAMDIRHLPVLNRGELVGVISDRDIRSFILPSDEQAAQPERARSRLELAVGDILQGDLISVHPDTDVGEAVDLMLDEKIGALPVVNELDGRILGIVSYVDVLRVARDLL